MFTPLELELLRLAAPIAAALFASSSGIAVAVIKWYWGSFVERIDALGGSVSAMDKKLGVFEADVRAQLAEIRSQTQHRDDVMAGNVAARIQRIEGICETQHGIKPLRRHDDTGGAASWLQSSDITGIGAR
jgi:hypothetical protein